MPLLQRARIWGTEECDTSDSHLSYVENRDKIVGLKRKLSKWKYIQIRKIYWASSLCPTPCRAKRKQITASVLLTQAGLSKSLQVPRRIHLHQRIRENFTDCLQRKSIRNFHCIAHNIVLKNIVFFIPINNSSHISSLSHVIPRSSSSILDTTTHPTCVKILALSWLLSSVSCIPPNSVIVSFLKWFILK